MIRKRCFYEIVLIVNYYYIILLQETQQIIYIGLNQIHHLFEINKKFNNII